MKDWSSVFGLEVVKPFCRKRDFEAVIASSALDCDMRDERDIGRGVPSVAKMKMKIRIVGFILGVGGLVCL
jgi:hypothetical protein